MTLVDVCSDIGKELICASNKKLLDFFSIVFPEENLGLIDNQEFREEVIQMITEKVEDNEEASEELYQYIFDEKITIDTEENYYDEEEFE